MMYHQSGFWGKELQELKEKYLLENNSFNKNTVFIRATIIDEVKGISEWLHMPDQSALIDYLNDVFIPSMILKSFNVKPKKLSSNIQSPKDLLLETMISRKHYIGVDNAKNARTLMNEFSEESKKDFPLAVERLEDEFNERWGKIYGIYFSLSTFLSISDLQRFLLEDCEYIEDTEEGTGQLEDEIGMTMPEWFKQWEEAIGNEFLTRKIMKTLNQVQF